MTAKKYATKSFVSYNAAYYVSRDGQEILPMTTREQSGLPHTDLIEIATKNFLDTSRTLNNGDKIIYGAIREEW